MRRYLVRLQNSKTFSSNDGMTILVRMRREVDEFGCVVKNLRVTEFAIEFDLYAPDESSKTRSIDSLSSEFGKLLNERDLRQGEEEQQLTDEQQKVPSLLQTKEETVRLSVDLFNEQRFWECHETMEQIWRREQNREEKDAQQGFILAASAFVHLQKNENDICLGMIPKALSKLESWKQDKYYSLDVSRLREKLRRIEKTREIQLFKL